MEHIQMGEETYQNVYADLRKYVDDMVLAIQQASIRRNVSAEGDLKCPLCGKPIRKTKWGYGCSGYPDCRFGFSAEISGKKITPKQAEALLTKGKTSLIKGFRKKNSEDTFDAYLMINEGKIQFAFPKKK